MSMIWTMYKFLPVFRHDLHKRYVKEWPCLVLFCDLFMLHRRTPKVLRARPENGNTITQ